MSVSHPLLSVSGLHCERDGVCLFTALEFRVQAGEILQVTGPNGAGKTTLLRALVGLSLSVQGDIVWNGHPVQDDRPGFNAQLLYIGHRMGISPLLTPEENLWAFPDLRRRCSRARLWQAMAACGLAGYEMQPCWQLSAGQNRRVLLARLRLSSQPLWILDEPFTSLDKEGRTALESLLHHHACQGGVVVLTSHHALDMPDSQLRQLPLGELG